MAVSSTSDIFFKIGSATVQGKNLATLKVIACQAEKISLADAGPFELKLTKYGNNKYFVLH